MFEKLKLLNLIIQIHFYRFLDNTLCGSGWLFTSSGHLTLPIDRSHNATLRRAGTEVGPATQPHCGYRGRPGRYLRSNARAHGNIFAYETFPSELRHEGYQYLHR